MSPQAYVKSSFRIILLCICITLASVQNMSEFKSVQCITYGEKADDQPLLPTLGGSSVNQIVSFNVTGENYNGESISVNENGGTIEIAGSKVYFTPWKHLFWIEKNMDAFFLANVTSTNFCIAFLYFANGSTSFEARIFEYKSATYQKVLYQGRSLVTKTPSSTRNVPVTQLSLTPQSKIENRLFATGPDLFIVGDRGYFKDAPSILKLYALRNTVNPKSGWNELWALLVGDSGDYYFSIIYMDMRDSSKVLLGHALRLNDYYVLEQRQLNATWRMKGDVYQLTVNTQQEVSLLRVDGFALKREDDSILSVALDKGIHTIGLENSTTESNGVRLVFNRWSDGNTSNPLTIDIRSNATLSAEYSKEFLLTIESSYSKVSGGGWYREGETVSIPTPATVENDEVKYVFEGWSGDVKTDGDSTTVIMDGPKTVSAKWNRFFRVTLTTEGLPEGTRVIYTLNDLGVPSEVPHSIQDWVQESSLLNFSVTLPEIHLMKEELFLEHWKDQQGKVITPPARLSGPGKLVAVFTNQKQSAQLSCSVSTANLLTTGILRIEGKITPPIEAEVTIEYRVSGEPWRPLCKVQTDTTGQYGYDWEPDVTGMLQIRAVWPGDASHSGAASEPQGVAVSQSVLKFKRLAGVFSNSTSSLYEEVKGPRDLSYTVTAPFTLAMGLTDATYADLANLKPLGPIAAIASGAALIGLFYILPWATLLLVLATIVTKRSVSRKGMLPLLTFWIFCLSYLVLEEMNVTDLLEPPRYLLTVFTAGLASTTGLLVALLPSLKISGLLAKRWKTRYDVAHVQTGDSSPLGK